MAKLINRSARNGFSRPWARLRLGVIVGEVALWAERPELFLRNLGREWEHFRRSPSPFSAEMFAAGLRLAAVSLRRSANHFEGFASELDCHALDELAEAALLEEAERLSGGS